MTANGGLLCHTQAMGPRLVSWPQAEEGHGDLIPVFAKALCSLGMVGGQGVGMGTPQGQDNLIPPRGWVTHPRRRSSAVPLAHVLPHPHPGTSVAVWGVQTPLSQVSGHQPLLVPGPSNPRWVRLGLEAPTLRAAPAVVAGTAAPGGAAGAAASPVTAAAVASMAMARAGAPAGAPA